MGYEIDLIFDQNENLDYETVVEKFSKLGAKIRDDEPYNPETDGIVAMDLPGFYPIWVYKKEQTQYMNGNWAYIRISWAEDSEEMISCLTDIMNLADKVGCRVYDGQIQQFITRETIDKVEASHGKSGRMIINMLGACRDSGSET